MKNEEVIRAELAELRDRGLQMQGPFPHEITDESLIRFGHRFLSSIFASYDFDLLRRDGLEPDPLDTFLKFEEQDSTEALIALAAIARVRDDENDTLKGTDAVFPDGVARLQRDDAAPEPLTVREACNKVIHAKAVRLDLAWATENPVWGRWYRAQGHDVTARYKVPALLLEGTRHGKGWTARVELVPFVIAAAMSDVGRWNLSGNK